MDTAILVLFSTFIIAYLVQRIFFHEKRYPKGPWGVPIFGHLPFFGASPPRTFAAWRKRYGDVYRIRLGSWNTVVINGYEAVKEAAEKPDDSFSGRPRFITNRLMAHFNGAESLAFGPFCSAYLQQRKMTATALRHFVGKAGKNTASLIEDETSDFVNSVLSESKTGPINIAKSIQYVSASIIHQLLFGRGQKDEVRKHLDLVVASGNRFTKFTGNGNPFDVMPWLRYFMPTRVKQFKEMLQERRRQRLESFNEHLKTYSKDNIRDVADMLLKLDSEQSIAIKNAHLIQQVWAYTTLGDLHGAGFDTTNKTMQWIVLYMAAYPEVQVRVQREIDEVVGNGRIVTVKDREKMVYTDATIYEVFRITSEVPFGVPKYTIKDTKVAGLDIDKDTVVFFNLHSIMHDKDYWGDPENFRPERLITDTGELDVDKVQHIVPFGMGRRRCVGEHFAKMEIFLIFTSLLQRCCISKAEECVLDLEPVPGLVYSPKEFRLVISER